jgi:hypothetical protein
MLISVTKADPILMPDEPGGRFLFRLRHNQNPLDLLPIRKILTII